MFSKKLSNFASAFIAVACVITLGGCDDQQSSSYIPLKVSGKTMGTYYMVQSSSYQGGEACLQSDCEAQYKKLVDVISTFDKNAELYKLDDLKSTEPVAISDEMASIIKGCLDYSARIDFAMDITVGPLVNLWGFGKDKRLNREPDEEAIAKARTLVGPDKFRIYEENGQSYVQKLLPEVRIDLATVGEGLGADAVAAMLDAKGVENYLSTVAGASRSKGHNPQGKPWRIGIEDPSTPDHKPFAAVCPLGMAMSTAGSYRNFYKDTQSGKIYSHAIDPKTGRPVEHNTMSVTVIAKTAFETDALDTGLLVMGADRALSWAEKTNTAIYTIELKDGKPYARFSSAFKKYLDCKEE